MEETREVAESRAPGAIALASAVAERVEIRAVRLIRSACSQSPRAAHVKQFKAELNRCSHHRLDERKNTIAVIAGFSLTGRDASQPPVAEPDLDVSADFLLLYTASSLAGLAQPNFEKFAELNGTYNAWPYWREFLQSTMSRMGISPFVLPVFRIAGSHAARSATPGDHTSPPPE
ncbi:MAG: hypothetical protein AB1601_12385 [Planctomycetota bacterium]